METPDSLPTLAPPVSRQDERWPRLATGSMVFLGAFLAFSMEPIVGRLVTPFFGGAVHVWTVSLMIFQALLLSGYLYAHLVAPRVGAWHLMLLLVPLLQWPLGFSSEVAPEAPITTLTSALLSQISLPFAVLSTTAVVAQSWWHGSPSNPQRSAPFFLYGVSNLGAMVALFSYPFLVEPLFGTTLQCWAWSIGYLTYAGVTVWTWYLLQPKRANCKSDEKFVPPPSRLTVLNWLALSAAPSALLLAVTNVIAMEVGSFPMVWVFPLALYLASFIVTFRERPGSFVSMIGFWWIEIALLALIAARYLAVGAWWLPLIMFAFFVLCVIANERLYCLRPHPSQLTSFYLTIAVGGWVGGLLVSLGAPMVFSGLVEYPVALLALVIASWKDGQLAWWRTTTLVKGGGRLAMLMVAGTIYGLSYWYAHDVYSLRNFYGISKIIDQPQTAELPPYRKLVHGATVHGLQYLTPDRRKEPLGYYYVGGALQQAVSLRNRSSRVAMIGLGAGAALPWFDAGDDLSIFELDEDMERIARSWFSYLDDAQGQVTVRVGDARLNLAEESRKISPRYDVLFIDAFSGDGIPTHLLTLEALDIYLSRLNENGVLVFHVSNRYYDLRPILKAAAQERGLAAVATSKPGARTSGIYLDTEAVVLTRRPEILAPLLAGEGWFAFDGRDGLSELRVWTDDYVNVLAPLVAKLTARFRDQ